MIRLRRTRIRRTKFYSQQGKCNIKIRLVRTVQKLSVELSILVV